MTIGVFIPQVTLGARKPGRTFSAATTAGQTTRFAAHAGNGRPLECVVTTTFDRAMVLAEIRLGKLDATLERLVVGVLGCDQVTQFQHIVLLEPRTCLTMVFDQNPARARVADV